jgi:hypothetical protein
VARKHKVCDSCKECRDCVELLRDELDRVQGELAEATDVADFWRRERDALADFVDDMLDTELEVTLTLVRKET